MSDERSGEVFGDGRWAFTTPGGAYTISSPAVADGAVVFGAHDGFVRALRADDGKALWQLQVRDGVSASPAVAGGVAFVPSMNGDLQAIRLEDGVPVWTHRFGGTALGSPAITGGSVILASGFPERRLTRLDGQTGRLIWQTEPVLAQFSESTPVVAGGVVLIGVMEGHYHAFDLATGALRWTYEADGIVAMSAPAVIDGRAYLLPGGASRKLHGIDVLTGLALPGFPVQLPAPAAAVADDLGAPLGRQHAVSSLAVAGDRLVFALRFDDSFDTNRDGQSDTWLAREYLTAVDASDGRVAWQLPNGRTVFDDPNELPKHWLCPTPVAYPSLAGSPLIAAASSLARTLRVIDPATGSERWAASLAGPALASPVFANGRLVTVQQNGVVEALLSSVNHPPPAPTLRDPSVRTADAAATTLRWGLAFDPDGDPVSYLVRVAGRELETAAGEGSLELPFALLPGSSVSFRVRSRDSRGALSAWSAASIIHAVATPSVSVNGGPALGLDRALASARAGDTVTLGAGTFRLTDALKLGSGVALRGAGPGATVLDASGLAVAVSVEGGGDKPSELSHLAIAGARRGVAIGQTADAALHHIVVRDCLEAGVDVAAGGRARLVNATLVADGEAVRSSGSILVKNSIVTESRVGLGAAQAGTVESRFNDVYENGSDYRNVTPGAGDLGKRVVFAERQRGDLRLAPHQPSTDQGDPEDDASSEPAPNGGRINLGAFGGTIEAELSAGPTVPEESPDGALSGCSTVPGRRKSLFSFVFLAGVLAVLRRRRR